MHHHHIAHNKPVLWEAEVLLEDAECWELSRDGSWSYTLWEPESQETVSELNFCCVIKLVLFKSHNSLKWAAVNFAINICASVLIAAIINTAHQILLSVTPGNT